MNSAMNSKKSRKILIGLDGVPHSLLLRLKSNGIIPNMSNIFNKGYFGRMEVCVPEISSVSWTSFMTGKQSGEHGIYGFMDFEPGSYTLIFPNYSNLHTSTIWDELCKQGKQSVIINMPATYPARPIQGAIISGFVAVDINKSFYPSSIGSFLHKLGYRIDIDTARSRTDADFLFADLEETLELRSRSVDFLWERFDWDLLMVVVTGTDRLMHFRWDAIENPNHPYHGHAMEYFKKVDTFVGRIYDRFVSEEGFDDELNSFYMISDHGFTGIQSEVYLNAWLQKKGFLRFENSHPKSIMEIGPGSKAFAMDPSRIYINLKGKFPLGCVDKKDYEKVRQEICMGLEELLFKNCELVIKSAFKKEDLYSGRYMDTAPDIVALSNHGFDLKGKVSGNSVFGQSDLTGMHTQDDAFFFSSTGVRCHSIFDGKKIILDDFKRSSLQC